MKLIDAERMANELMAEYGLDTGKGVTRYYMDGNDAFGRDEHVRLARLQQPWKFVWMPKSARNCLGKCSYTHREIRLNMSYVALNEEHVVRDTILHEIAHALTPGSYHGYAWARKCEEIGAVPERCKRKGSHNGDFTSVGGNYSAECPFCGHVFQAAKKAKRFMMGGQYCPCPSARRAARDRFTDGRPYQGLVWTKNTGDPRRHQVEQEIAEYQRAKKKRTVRHTTKKSGSIGDFCRNLIRTTSMTNGEIAEAARKEFGSKTTAASVASYRCRMK